MYDFNTGDWNSRTFRERFSNHVTRVEVPSGPSLWVERNGERKVKQYDSIEKAIAAHIRKVKKLVEANALEALPRLHFRRGEEVQILEISICYPDDPEDVPTATHLIAFNRRVRSLRRAGFELVVPEWTDTKIEGHDFFEDVASEQGTVETRRFFRPPNGSEYGPEARWEDGALFDFGVQINEMAEGPRFYFEAHHPGAERSLRCILTHHLGQRRGAQLWFAAGGEVEKCRLIDSRGYDELVLDGDDLALMDPEANEVDTARFEAAAEKARAAAKSEPSRKAFLEIAGQVEAASAADYGRTIDELIPELGPKVQAWPEALRSAPPLWINRIILGALPTESLHLCSALNIAPAIADHFMKNPLYAKLVAWLLSLEEKCPRLVGLSMNRDVLIRLPTEHDDERFHPPSVRNARNESFYLPHLKLLLESPMFRDVKVFDASLGDSYYTPSQHSSSSLDGRELRLGQVVRHAAQVEVVDLSNHGSSWEHFDSLKSIPSLRELRVGGIFALDDKDIHQLAECCPNLEVLELAQPVSLGLWDEDIDFENADYNPELWCTRKRSDLKAHMLTKKGIQALNRLGQLRALVVQGTLEADANPYESTLLEALNTLREDITLITGGAWDRPKPWARYFEK